MKRRPKDLRTFSRMTSKQMAKGMGLSEGEVKESLLKLIEHGFMRPCYDSSGILIPGLYEIPENYDKYIGTIIYVGLALSRAGVRRRQ